MIQVRFLNAALKTNPFLITTQTMEAEDAKATKRKAEEELEVSATKKQKLETATTLVAEGCKLCKKFFFVGHTGSTDTCNRCIEDPDWKSKLSKPPVRSMYSFYHPKEYTEEELAKMALAREVKFKSWWEKEQKKWAEVGPSIKPIFLCGFDGSKTCSTAGCAYLVGENRGYECWAETYREYLLLDNKLTASLCQKCFLAQKRGFPPHIIASHRPGVCDRHNEILELNDVDEYGPWWACVSCFCEACPKT
jgi:hypothetical protein